MATKVKSFIAGFFVCLLLTGTAVYAMEPTAAELTFRKITYMFDGAEKKPPEGMDGFIYNGSLFVPLRFISESLNKDIEWDEAESTVWVGKKATDLYLNEIKPSRVEGTIKPRYGTVHLAGMYYLNGVTVSFPEEIQSNKEITVQYNLNGQYTRFSGLIGIDDSTKNSDSLGTVKMIGDNKELQVFSSLKGGNVAQTFEQDVTGIATLKIVYRRETTEALTIGIAEPVLHR